MADVTNHYNSCCVNKDDKRTTNSQCFIMLVRNWNGIEACIDNTSVMLRYIRSFMSFYLLVD